MNPDAKVKMRGVQVGQVESIETGPTARPPCTWRWIPSQLQLHSVQRRRRHHVVDGVRRQVRRARRAARPVGDSRCSQGPGARRQHVTVEINTVFQQLDLGARGKIDPAKLNETLGAISGAFNGRGEKLGQTVTDFDQLLAKLNPSLPQHRAATSRRAAGALNAYADAAPDLVDDRREHHHGQRHDRRRGEEPRHVPGQRHRAGRHRQRRDRRQPPGAHRCPAPAGADHRPAQPVPATTCAAASRA